MEFQLLSVEVVTGELYNYCDRNVLFLDSSYNRLEEETRVDTRFALFGVSAHGESVCVLVSGFRLFFYVALSMTDEWRLRQDACDAHVTVEHRKRAFGWVPDGSRIDDTRAFPYARVEFRSKVRYEWGRARLSKLGYELCEHRVGLTEKFMAQCGIRPGGWVRVVGGTEPEHGRVTVSTVELEVGYTGVHPLETSATAPLTIVAVDIECMSEDHASFPEVTRDGDAVIAIGTTVWVYGDTAPRRRIMQMVSSTPSTPACRHYACEYDLLVGWRDLIAVEINPDVVTSYNGTGFDFAYLSGRAARFKCTTRFTSLGRFVMHSYGLRTKELTSAAKGKNILSWFPMPGRIQFDLFLMVKDTQKLSSYALDDVAHMFLNAEKVTLVPDPGVVQHLLDQAAPVFGVPLERETPLAWAHRVASRGDQCSFNALVRPVMDVCGTNNYHCLFRLYSSSGPYAATSHAAIAEYCQVDCDLVVRLVDRMNVIANLLQMSYVCNTLPDDVCNRGQQIKTFNLLARCAHVRGYVLNHVNVEWQGGEYEGAKVLDPVVGYYGVPVVTLDFASLYPSLMRKHNLCFSSLVLDPQYMGLPGARYEQYTFGGCTWTFQVHARGLLPEILESLLEARKAKKREMRTLEKGSLAYRLCDGAQLALKVSCNSVYGFCGTGSKGMFPCMPVAAATTANGRRLIEATQALVSAAPFHARVIYGDTDSVMVTFPGVTTLEAAFARGREAAAAASVAFAPVQLEFEKVFMPYLLILKKCYAGMKYEDDPGHAPVMDVKGLANKRRDNCGLVRTLLDDILRLSMVDRDPGAAYALVERTLQDLVCGRVPLELLVITMAYREGCVTKQPQSEVVRKMQSRRAFDVPRSGDRVPFVIVEGGRGRKVYERAEHPQYAAAHRLKPDVEYYVENQLRNRVDTLLRFLPVPSVDALFDYAVRRARGKRASSYSILSYFQKDGGIDNGWGERVNKRARN